MPRWPVVKLRLLQHTNPPCSFFFGGIFPFGINFGFELATANQLLQVADNGAPGDAKFASEGGDVGTLAGFSKLLANPVLATEPVGGAAEEVESVGAMGAFQSFELADGFFFTA